MPCRPDSSVLICPRGATGRCPSRHAFEHQRERADAGMVADRYRSPTRAPAGSSTGHRSAVRPPSQWRRASHTADRRYGSISASTRSCRRAAAWRCQPPIRVVLDAVPVAVHPGAWHVVRIDDPCARQAPFAGHRNAATPARSRLRDLDGSRELAGSSGTSSRMPVTQDARRGPAPLTTNARGERPARSSIARPALSTPCSSNGRPMSCRPSGRPWRRARRHRHAGQAGEVRRSR